MLSRRVELIKKSCTLASDGPLVFHHIPKTAGSSFTQLLRTLFTLEEISDAATDFELLDLERSSKIGQYKLFTGHYSYDGLMNHFGTAVRLTFLRDPIERCVSQYHNWNNAERIPKSWLDRGAAIPDAQNAVELAQSMSLMEFVSSTNAYISDSAQNMQTRYLARQHPWEPVRDFYDKNLVDSAKRNLERDFAFYGITEAFERSKTMLAATLGIRPWTDTDALMTNFNPAKSSGHAKYAISSTERELVESFNRMDIELYQFALELFEYRFDRVSAEAIARLYELQLQQLPDSNESNAWVELDIGNGYGARGFHYAEQLSSRDGQQKTFRWTGLSDEASVELQLPLRHLGRIRIEINVLACMAPACLETLAVTLNDSVPTRIAKLQYGSEQLVRAEFLLPEPQNRWLVHTLRIRSSLEKENKSSGTARWLGIAVDKIRAFEF